jgi:hypothetical protein
MYSKDYAEYIISAQLIPIAPILKNKKPFITLFCWRFLGYRNIFDKIQNPTKFTD